MTDTAWTAGPWRTDDGEYDSRWSVDTDGEGEWFTLTAKGRDVPVAFVTGASRGLHYSDPTTEANARLIAAAPDLYEALAGLLDYDEQDEDCAATMAHVAARDAARAALAKARGEHPMTDTREAAIERVRAYVEAWSGYKDSAVACMRSDSPLILGDLRLLLTDRQPSEAPVTADDGWRPIESHGGDCLPILVGRARPARGSSVLAAFMDATGVWRVLGSYAGMDVLPYEPSHWMPLPPAPPTGEGGDR